MARAQRFRCPICSAALDPDSEIDHVVPRSLGGSDSVKNLRLVHRRCNRSRGAKL
jgi:5-methylcytosine-specific restriction endonuclease McrA